MDVSGNNDAAGTPVQVFDCHASGSQQFQWAGPDPTFPDTPPGSIIYAESGHFCLDIVGGATTNGTPVQIFTCHGQLNQQFMYVNGNIMVYYTTRGPKCLESPDPNFTNGTQLVIDDCKGTDQQQFQIK
jgi:hypothetical protein